MHDLAKQAEIRLPDILGDIDGRSAAWDPPAEQPIEPDAPPDDARPDNGGSRVTGS